MTSSGSRAREGYANISMLGSFDCALARKYQGEAVFKGCMGVGEGGGGLVVEKMNILIRQLNLCASSMSCCACEGNAKISMLGVCECFGQETLV